MGADTGTRTVSIPIRRKHPGAQKAIRPLEELASWSFLVSHCSCKAKRNQSLRMGMGPCKSPCTKNPEHCSQEARQGKNLCQQIPISHKLLQRMPLRFVFGNGMEHLHDDDDQQPRLDRGMDLLQLRHLWLVKCHSLAVVALRNFVSRSMAAHQFNC